MAIPLIDTSVVVISRILRGVSIFDGGRDHISHRMIAWGVSRKRSAILIWSLAGLFSLLAIVINQVSNPFIQILPIFGLLSIAILIIFFLRMPILR
jgi:UDP-GlcNAc:undecaprenyl-phosphate GlcNAc-1-phosphate transferase